MRNSGFTSWLARILGGLVLVFGGVQTAWIFWSDWKNFALGSLAVAAVGVAVMFHAEARERPRRLLRRAHQSLGLPSQWSVEVDRALPEGGNAPLVVTRSDAARFVIDVRDYKEVSSRKTIGGKDEGVLLGANGKSLTPDPLPKLRHAARSLEAIPVLWLPEAPSPRNIRMPSSNLIVVMGAARHLKHALLGAEAFTASTVSGNSGYA